MAFLENVDEMPQNFLEHNRKITNIDNNRPLLLSAYMITNCERKYLYVSNICKILRD